MRRADLDAIKSKIVGLKQTEASWNDIEAVKARYDELGKLVQTETGDGTAMNPYKTWKVGKDVEEGKWYLTPEHGYLWLAIKSGTPSSEVDKEYFDVVGID